MRNDKVAAAESMVDPLALRERDLGGIVNDEGAGREASGESADREVFGAATEPVADPVTNRRGRWTVRDPSHGEPASAA